MEPYSFLHSTVQLENYALLKAANIENQSIMNNKKQLNDKIKLETGSIYGEDKLPSFPGESIR